MGEERSHHQGMKESGQRGAKPGSWSRSLIRSVLERKLRRRVPICQGPGVTAHA